ncbi:alkaline phosphatase D family protein [Polymorphobacter fuscus]|uniref:Alkaline phosphatase n=1 Tax=Sandarakinorhabdus fusca TaxID=1439888 RepID=A0A7C9KM96_9SPHN|nr:alkaline phosphatase D family protein [Polymorphobacter fuscus]KAB7647559.1 alkaline phosphatase D family protein [Polymorphobacter fuscus]MQT16824.1 alkaline phosphatase [Polymorphobacter fuscus]NJC09188.1 alkaline phosphatase D [Polymorphobacter fuscus]
MRLELDRRAFFTATAAGLLLPVRPALAGIWADKGFTHGVASGDPGADSIKLWTRYASGDGRDAVLKVEVAADTGFRQIIARSEAVAGPATWGTAQARITGLPDGKWVYYRFTAPDGSKSPVGRTRSLPSGTLSKYNVAVFSCSNKPFGWFNAYAHAAARDDIDLVVHVGDYIYEYQAGSYPAAAEALTGRDILPLNEIVALDDYRQRYASYRVDPGLQELHRRFPMVSIWDDHEIANDTWTGGAQNHQPEDGDWALRKAAATKAHAEWLPGPDRMYQRYDIGDLISLITLDTRATGRDKQLDIGAAMRGGTPGLVAFRDGPLNDPARQLLGVEQEAWFADTIKASVADGKKWQLVAQQVIMGDVLTPKDALSFLAADADPRAQAYVKGGMAAASVGISAAMDMWAGYPQARKRVLQAAQAANADMVVVSGDSHNGWAFNLAEGGKPAGVEFAGQSVTSPGYESALKGDPAKIRDAVVAASPGLTWCDTSRRGYMTVGFTPDAARCDFVFMSTIRERSTALGKGQGATVKRGKRVMELV